MGIVATTSLPVVDRPNADRWNAARSCQNEKIQTNFKFGQANSLSMVEPKLKPSFLHFCFLVASRYYQVYIVEVRQNIFAALIRAKQTWTRLGLQCQTPI